MSRASVLDVGIAILMCLEATHKAGYVFNDLKLDNLMVGLNQKLSMIISKKSVFSDCSIHLVDFGYATKYKDKKGNHIELGELPSFRGNIIFASRDQMEFKTTSRRDDLISMCYILVYLLHRGKLLDIDITSNLEV
jgi:casein kinase 1